ncbi:hypothetical protein ACTD5D_20460 [Nocardia takedensis]|uniref:hypothetical protein n=1 Tax=Nocardia takedensis TaxID=259390 RepID=UPI003F773DCC
MRAEIGSPAATGLRLASAEHEPDGIVTTGIPDVDHHELNRLVEAYEKVTDFLINATNRVRSDDEARLPTDRLDHIIIPRTDIGGQIVALAATAGTDDAEVALRRLWAADQRVINDRDLVSAHTTVPTSGFVLADIQVALAQMARLTALDSATSPQITETSHKIAEVRDRIRQLMDADNFRPENRSIIDAHITQILVNQDHQQAGLYAWPSVSALDSRTRRLTAVRTQPGHRGFSDALRLHHLTQAIHLDGLIPADPHRDLVLDALLSRQRDYLWTAIETDTSLSTATAAALTGIMQYDPATPIPNHHVVTPLRAHPADGPPTPDTTAVPGQPYRILLPRGEHEWYLGIENGRWTARVHQLYPAFPTLRREIGAAHYDSAEQMLDAVTTEPTVLAPEGREVILAPLDIPEPVRTALYRAQELCERPSSPAATTGHKVTPSAAPAPHSADKRHPTRRQPPPPPPPPRRRI